MATGSPTVQPVSGQPTEFSATRNYIPLLAAYPQWVGFSTCELAPGFVIKEATEADKEMVAKANRDWAKLITTEQITPTQPQGISHLIIIDERTYGRYVEDNIFRELKIKPPPQTRHLDLGSLFKMIVLSFNLFKIFPLYYTHYAVTEDLERHQFFVAPLRFGAATSTTTRYKTLGRYCEPQTYDLTDDGKISCDNIRMAFNVLEKYYRHNYWKRGRVGVALYNFWNGLFLDDPTLAFVALTAILETFSNLSKDGNDPVLDQITRHVPALVPLDAHRLPVTSDRVAALYGIRSDIAHGSFGLRGHGNVTWETTIIDAKFANVAVSKCSEIMSIAVQMLHRVLFCPELLNAIENAQSPDGQRRAMRKYVDALLTQPTDRTVPNTAGCA